MGTSKMTMTVHSIKNGKVRIAIEFPKGAQTCERNFAKRASPVRISTPSTEGKRQILLFGGENGGEILINNGQSSVRIRIVNVQKTSVQLRIEGQEIDAQ